MPSSDSSTSASLPSAGTDALSSVRMFDRYTLVRELGKGATGVVYLAHDETTKLPVALKVISLGDAGSSLNRRLRRLFRGEAAMAQQLNHPNIVRIYDAGIEHDSAWLAMEYVEGEPLSQYTAFNTLLPPHRVVGLIFKAAMALDYAGQRGIVHRDIKPDNILLTADDDIKITDFGLALDLKKKSAGDTTFITGVGSPAYMSPEQIKEYPLNPQTDLYSLGVLLFEMLTGRRPFRGRNYAGLIYKIINTEPPYPSALNPSVPASLDPIVRKALEKDLYSRFRRGAKFAQDLAAVKFQILESDDLENFNRRFSMLRQCRAFVDFDNEEIWEVLRISTVRIIHEGYPVMHEDEPGESFGVILQGKVEISKTGKRLAQLEAGDVLGEIAFLSRTDKRRDTTALALEDVTYLEINPSAFALSSEECKEHFQNLLFDTIRNRLNSAREQLLGHLDQARPPVASAGSTDLDLMPLDD